MKIPNILSFFKENKKEKNNNNYSKSKKIDIDYKELINKATINAEELFKINQPTIFSLALENNIASKFDNYSLLTKDKNLCIGYSIDGISYSSISADNELKLVLARNAFFSSLHPELEVTIICKKEKIIIDTKTDSIKNLHAKKVIEKWEINKEAFIIKYYLLISTKTKQLTGVLEDYKNKITKEKDDNQEDDENLSENKTAQSTHNTIESKVNLLNEAKVKIKNTLSQFNIKLMESNEILNLYASYSNMKHTNLKYSNSLISDCYITSNMEFKKDYMVFHRNDGKKIYARFLSIKAYETEEVSSLISTSVLRQNKEFMIFIHTECYPKDKAIKRIKDIKPFTIDEVKVELENLIKAIQTDRETLMLVSYSILVTANSKEYLDENCNDLIGVLENQNLAVVRETLNQKPLFFSFFPSRGNLNARKRSLQSSNLSTIITFENDIVGIKENRWGKMPITYFKHLSGSPFLFNFHEDESKSAAGHTIIVGGTGSGKTMLTQFLMLNLFKYDINIFAMDKLRGMRVFTEFYGGEYNDAEDNFKLNPFTLANTMENKQFLNFFLCKMADIKKGEYKHANQVAKTIKALMSYTKTTPTLEDFQTALPTDYEIDLKAKYQKYLDSMFNNKEDTLEFSKQLSILNMDSILKNPDLASLSALYIFHKLKNVSKNSGKGFFIFIDELKDYLLEETMRESILEAILEIRKINGIIMMAVQNLDFFNEIPKSQSFIDNMSNFIIFPTTDESVLENLKIKAQLTGGEIDFLRKTQISERKILFKQKRLNKSAILDVDLSSLGRYLNTFSSEALDVNRMMDLKRFHADRWRELYLQGES
ncbi:AAA family ATPase [Helicobacter winghamensis]|uniref:VirB4 family type IV secretion/conjugal transfer ATPase n=1 Tax=Helicobacter winghamensis TaxID=157268 RepID=UPI0027A7A216